VRLAVLVILVGLLAAVPARAQAPSGAAPPSAATDTTDGPGPGRWFYQGLPYGSEALVHPLRLIFNGGFGTLAFDNRSNRLGNVDFEHGWNRLWADLEAPGVTIRETGWSRFLSAEVIPVRVRRESGQYWPNYTLHLIGGGMSHVMMREWFEQHGYPHAGVAAGVTLTAYHVLNEVVEAAERTAPSTDPVADLLLFDPAGIWLFSHSGVKQFFSRRLNLRDWSTQPAIDPATGAVVNNGQNFSIKLKLPRSDRWSLFYYFGNHGELGLSYRRKDGSAISAGAGISATRLVDLGNGLHTADLLPSAGIFYDRNGSLLFSVTMSRKSRDGIRVNAYPGLVRLGEWTAGLFMVFSDDGNAMAGVHLLQLPVGLAGRP
jgi:hypothetical protein